MNTVAPGDAAGPVIADDFEAMLALSRELTALSTLHDLREAIAGPLRPLLPSRDISVLRSSHGTWQAVIGPQDGSERISEYAWTPLLVEGKTIGMLGIGAPSVGGPTGRRAEGATALLAMAAQNIIALDNLREDSVRDGLTRCFNRVYAMEALESNLRRANRTGFPVSILLIDLDNFERINDEFGHPPGDAVLAAVAAQLHGMLRQSDVRCRLGGDEFLVILPDTALEDAVRVSESVRNAIEELAILSVRGKVKITASVGVATAGCGDTIDVPAFVDRADAALSRAKHAGRNCVKACASSTSPVQSKLRLATSRPA